MLTQRSLENISRFNELTSNYKRIFRYRLKMRVRESLKELLYILTKLQELKISLDDVVELEDLKEIVGAYVKMKEGST